MRKALAVFVGVIFGIVGFFVGIFAAEYFFTDSTFAAWAGAILGALIFGFGTYFYRKNNEKCAKCGALWSVKFSHTEILSQSTVSETTRSGGYADTNKILKRDKNGDPIRYGVKYDYNTKNYLVGQERLVYQCRNCGNETSKTREFKKQV